MIICLTIFIEGYKTNKIQPRQVFTENQKAEYGPVESHCHFKSIVRLINKNMEKYGGQIRTKSNKLNGSKNPWFQDFTMSLRILKRFGLKGIETYQ